MSKKFSILEKVSAIRAIMSVAKSVQERMPDASVEDVVDAIDTAVLMKLSRLQQKPFADLKANQIATLGALKVAKSVMGDVLEILGDEETTRELDADERTALADLKAKRKETAAKSAAKRKAKAKAEAKVGEDQDDEDEGQETLALA